MLTSRMSLALVALGALGRVLNAQPQVRTEFVDAARVGGTHRFHVILPPCYDTTKVYPVLWLLHGYGATDSIRFRRTKLLAHPASYPLIVVLPDAERSWYVNAQGRPNAEYESYLVEDLHAAVAARFRIDTLREAVGGVWMGGYGAAILALKHPARYRYAALLLPALSVPDSLAPGDTTLDEGIGRSLEVAFGSASGQYRRQNDPFLLLRDARAAALPVFRVVVASQDEYPSFARVARQWVNAARARGVRIEYDEVSGVHNMLSADAALPRTLESLWRVLGQARPPSNDR